MTLQPKNEIKLAGRIIRLDQVDTRHTFLFGVSRSGNHKIDGAKFDQFHVTALGTAHEKLAIHQLKVGDEISFTGWAQVDAKNNYRLRIMIMEAADIDAIAKS